jgi:hypothetical protein
MAKKSKPSRGKRVPARSAARKAAPRKTAARKTAAAAPTGKPLPAQMLDLITGYWTSQMVFVVARLGVADHLKKGAKPVAELAAAVGADAQRLHRVLRALAASGLFVEKGAGRFALTELGSTLRSDVPFSMRNFALMMVDDYNWKSWEKLHDGIVQPITPLDGALGCKVFEYLQAHPDKMRVFAESMSSISGAECPAIAAGYDFGRIEHLVDIGGSQGHLLAAVLRAHAGVKGTLFDMPPVVEQAKQAPFLQAKELAGRIDFVGGDFFAGVPQGADGYVMKYILHDWNDELCVQILTRCRQAMAKGGRVLVVDNVVPAGNDPHWGKQLDINMLVLTGGRERTVADFKQLFDRAGLRLKKVHPTACPLSVVEAVAAR